jgi:hypothetical protein
MHALEGGVLMANRLEWKGEDLKGRAANAALRAIDETTEAAAERTRANHPGWKSITGTAEASIRSVPARMLKRGPRGAVEGGAGDAFYFVILEVKNGAAMRTAADVEFPRLHDRMNRHFGRLG